MVQFFWLSSREAVPDLAANKNEAVREGSGPNAAALPMFSDVQRRVALECPRLPERCLSIECTRLKGYGPAGAIRRALHWTLVEDFRCLHTRQYACMNRSGALES